MPPSAAVCSTAGVGGVATATLRNDADTASKGVVCRHNNMAYTGANPIGASPYNYPAGKYITPITNGTGPDACISTDHYAAVPRHYWKTEVEWCDKAVSTPTTNGWATATATASGRASRSRTPRTSIPRFYQFGAAGGADNTTTSAFQRVDLDISKRATATYQHDLDRRLRRRVDHPQLRRGDDQLRQLVRVLPHAHHGGEDGDLAGVPRQAAATLQPR